MKKNLLILIGIFLGFTNAPAAVLTINYDASIGVSGLTAASQVYLHSGANDVAGPLDGSTWNYVVGNWGNADGIGEMTNVGNNQWTITFDPIAYYNQAANGPVGGTSIQRIGLVFRNGDGSLTGKDANNADIFIDLSGASPLVYNSIGTLFNGVTVFYTQSTFSTVNLSGFNADVVANGYGYPYTTTTADIDGFSDYLIDGTIDVLGGDPPPTEYLPYDGIINSATSIGNKFQLQNYSTNNALRLDYQGAGGTLNFTVPRSANEVFVLGTSGNGASTCDITVNFTDLSSQTFIGINFNDWFFETPYTVKGIGLAYCCGVNPQAGIDNPRLYEAMLPLDIGNFTKLISDISISKTNGAGILNIFAVSISTTENSNDLICNATHMALGVFYSGDNTSASPFDPRDNDVANAGYNCSSPNNTLWYSYTPLINGNYEIVTTSSSTAGLDAWVGHFSSTDCNGALIYYNCFKGTNIGDTVVNSTSLNAGETYFFMIDGFSGAVGDFSIALRESACTSPPNAGTTIASSASVCLNDVVHFSLSGNSGGVGQTYQWQKSPDDITWTNITGAIQDQSADTIKAATYYRCEITCGGFSTASFSVQVVLNSYLQCYCISTALYDNLYDIGNVKIMAFNTGTIYLNNGDSINSINNSTAINQYTDFTGLPATNLQTGVPYSISVTNINANSYRYQGCYSTLFIDLNHNGIFDLTTEAFQIGYAPPSQNIKTATVIIPSSAVLGLTRMRFVLDNFGSSSQDACGTYSAGETEDYSVNLSAGPSCINPANAGQATASSFSVCPTDDVTLSLTGSFSTGVGLTFKWQKSVDQGANWTFITGATNATYTSDSLGGARYRCALKCNFGSTVYSNYVDIANNPGNQCYCYSGAIYFQTGNDNIGNVTIAGLNNGIDTAATLNPSSIVPYTDFTDLPPTNLMQGTTYPISLTQINQWGYYNCSFYVFIDFNQDGIFNTSDEYFYIGPTSGITGGNTIYGNITIPASALPGTTRMRIILIEGGGAGTPSPCATYFYGETEDYTVSILCGPLTLSNAGPDQLNLCGLSTNLTGNTPALGMGIWTVSSGAGAVLANSSNATTDRKSVV